MRTEIDSGAGVEVENKAEIKIMNETRYKMPIIIEKIGQKSRPGPRIEVMVEKPLRQPCTEVNATKQLSGGRIETYTVLSGSPFNLSTGRSQIAHQFVRKRTSVGYWIPRPQRAGYLDSKGSTFYFGK
ncbi:hypothetical protein EVAR_93238_1 [Eumeta japonica]|uniref:Uncharacterized protein n=1 Tax=Eumeta variegata TaxID=151549 RepID=A0A4C1TXT9_EUMVA|nr:hypothetical protein EVAR_93238_1 [Eumeta japonica]